MPSRFRKICQTAVASFALVAGFSSTALAEGASHYPNKPITIIVPFKGGGPASTALLAGQVDLMFEQTGAALPSIQAGKIRPLAVTSAKRLSSMPEVPTFADAGYPQVLASNWMGYIAPKGTPSAVVAKLHAAFVKAINHPDVKERILSQDNELGGGSSKEFADFIEAESAKWSKLVKERDIRIE
ncbi:Bug family tripartite tricarboxylate transporter substrate binding protein [Variovorax sp. HW608]|uniref:Bug family tripartite tricarboxylate transporter substrate binding protein n=1 Tax=Variovorax sp. HW608 TaxID=1034889 RepID=UPI000B5AEA17|nr:tripartite tricarboxylate transporter substrate binding protein [Variovorax sp. HW608]